MIIEGGFRSILLWPYVAYKVPDIVPFAATSLFLYFAKDDLPDNLFAVYIMLGITYIASSTRPHVHVDLDK
jgi:hypothetical protein